MIHGNVLDRKACFSTAGGQFLTMRLHVAGSTRGRRPFMNWFGLGRKSSLKAPVPQDDGHTGGHSAGGAPVKDGGDSPPPPSVRELLREQVESAGLPLEILEAARAECDRLAHVDPASPEHAIGFNYLEFLLSLPWNSATKDDLDIVHAEELLNARHHGLRLVKERILEFLAVKNLRATSPPRILLVDDEVIARENLSIVFESDGYDVTAVGNGLEALAAMEKTACGHRGFGPQDGRHGRAGVVGRAAQAVARHQGRHADRIRHGKDGRGRHAAGCGPVSWQTRQPHETARPCRQAAGAEPQGAESARSGAVLHRPPGYGQNVHRQSHCRSHGQEVLSTESGRTARRGRTARPQADLCGGHAGTHHPGSAKGRVAQPGHHARRDGQDRPGLSGRCHGRAARTARPGAERRLCGPLHGAAVRSVRGAFHLHGQRSGASSGSIARPAGSDRVFQLHPPGEVRDRLPVSDAGAIAAARAG